MSNAMDDPIMEEIIRRLLNELAPYPEFQLVAQDRSADRRRRDQEGCHQRKQANSDEQNMPR